MAKLNTTFQNIPIPSLNTDTRGATAAFRSAREGFTTWQDAVDKRATNQALQSLLDADGNVSRDRLAGLQGSPGVNYADLLGEVRAAEIGQRAAAAEGRAVETHQNAMERHVADMIGINFENEHLDERFNAEMSALSAQELRDKLDADVSRGVLTQQEADRVLQSQQAAATSEIDNLLQGVNTATLPDREAAYERLMEAAVGNFKVENQHLAGDKLNDALQGAMPGIQSRIQNQLGQVEQDWRDEERAKLLSQFVGQSRYAHTPAMQDYMKAQEMAAQAAIADATRRDGDRQARINDVKKAGGSAYTIENGRIVFVPEGNRASKAINTGNEAMEGLAADLLDGNTSDEAMGFLNKLVAAAGGDRNVVNEVAREFKLGGDKWYTAQFWKDKKLQSDAIKAAEEWAAQLKGEARKLVESGNQPAPEPTSAARLAALLRQDADNSEATSLENDKLAATVESLQQALEAERAAKGGRKDQVGRRTHWGSR
jgi:hypothetical protein